MDPANPRGIHQVQTLKKEIRQSQAQLRDFLERLCGDISTPEQIETLLCKTIQEQMATREAAKTDAKRLTYASQTFTVTLTPEDQSREFGYRASGGYWNNYSRGLVLDVQLNGQASEAIRPVQFDREGSSDRIPTIVRDALVVIFSSGITTALYHLLRAWVDKKNGRKIRFKVGNTELDVTQMSDTEFLQLFQSLIEWYEHERRRGAAVGGRISVKRK